MNHANILVIDDERQIRRLLRVTLESAGYTVREAETAQLGLVEAAQQPPDAIIVDLGLPDIDGTKAIQRLREWTNVPILVLSVREAEDDKVTAFDVGADDYLTKPFSARELLARLRAIMRRTTPAQEPAIVSFGDVEVDLASRVVRKAGAEVRLTVKEYALLRLLVQYRGKVVTHRQLLRELWGPNAEESTHYLRVHMNHLRQKLEPEPARPRHLRTDAGIGYRLVVD
ncbi:response regulator [Opitutus sp. ER46]|uniref:response regulator n=1 Tax=Opitutus sp. ER46 TaxID=2161864 RepID=UPI000D2F7F50|nr:response regulator [Opitutus sp. ER46]PTX92282.1 DNA-binding response regulator [Opitutus sp. ER46]